jgi:NADH-quinone oxidoreductase subunit D
MDRTINVGSISAEQAISYFTGPNLRAAGVDYDVYRTALQLL